MRTLFLLLFLIPFACSGQIVGVSGQWSDFEKAQFSATMQLPIPYKVGIIDYKRKEFFWLMNGGIDYVGGKSTVSGLNIKPISFGITTIDSYFENPANVMIGADVGYNINFTHGNDGVILTPYLYSDYKMFYMKFGYDYNTFHNEGQFYVRLGVGIGVGFLKMKNK